MQRISRACHGSWCGRTGGSHSRAGKCDTRYRQPAGHWGCGINNAWHSASNSLCTCRKDRCNRRDTCGSTQGIHGGWYSRTRNNNEGRACNLGVLDREIRIEDLWVLDGMGGRMHGNCCDSRGQLRHTCDGLRCTCHNWETFDNIRLDCTCDNLYGLVGLCTGRCRVTRTYRAEHISGNYHASRKARQDSYYDKSERKQDMEAALAAAWKGKCADAGCKLGNARQLRWSCHWSFQDLFSG